MKRIALVLLFLFLLIHSDFGQPLRIINGEAIHMSVQGQSGSIDFIVLDTALSQQKPLFLWYQGSLPYPLFVNYSNESIWMLRGGIYNMDIEYIKKKYHIVVISMPEAPVIADRNELNESFYYVPDLSIPNRLSEACYRADYLENDSWRAITILDYLKQKDWVEPSILVVAGHSQGAKVASHIASNYSKVTPLGLFAPNPFGKIDEMFRKIRKAAEGGAISWEEAQRRIEGQYAFYERCADPEWRETDPSLISWYSFSSYTVLHDWLQMKIPLYIAYGMRDASSELCDLVPLYFIKEGKTNLTRKSYPDLEHNFFEVTKNEEVDYEAAHWKKVMNDFIVWIR